MMEDCNYCGGYERIACDEASNCGLFSDFCPICNYSWDCSDCNKKKEV
jgi:hypothetical protein